VLFISYYIIHTENLVEELFMSTERLVKWSKEALGFFEKSENKSIELTFMMSQANENQTGEGFEEFVNSINKLGPKINKLVIIDTTFLYRHCVPEFSQHLNENIATIWFLNNRNSINKIQCDVSIESYVKQVNSNLFKQWYNKIVKDFEIVEDFKKLLMHEAKMFFSKGKGSFDECLKFLLEEYAHVCAFLKNRNIVYPRPFSPTMLNVIERYALNITGVHYDVSNRVRKYNGKDLRKDVNEKIVLLLEEKDLKVNFFAINKNGRYIYKNNVYQNTIGKTPYVTDSAAWEISMDIMQKNERRISEEKAPNGNYYLSIKSPLVINGKVEGIIGLAVDITDRKKKEELENKLKMREELYKIAREVSHDIASPLSSLKAVEYIYKEKLEEADLKMLTLAIRSIEKMAGKMLSKYRLNECIEKGRREEVKEKEEEKYIYLSERLLDIVETEKYKKEEEKVEIKLDIEKGKEKVYIRGDEVDFRRMMTNIIKNGVEAMEGKKGEIKVGYKVKEEEEIVEIRVKDNGKGMPKEMVEKLMKGEKIGTTKKDGYGIGTQQIMGTIKAMKGKIKIDSKEGVETEFILTFPEVQKPH
jgi:signal transduction histidine kinase